MISFSLSAVARLGVPPGKWFCLARTGLGYPQYSCCVCQLHDDTFRKFWNQSLGNENHKDRLKGAIDQTLTELEYERNDIETMNNRIMDLVTSKDNYIVNLDFVEFSKNQKVVILTDGPECLVKMIFPHIEYSNKSTTQIESLIHVGTNSSDLRFSETKFLISKKIESTRNVKVFPKLNRIVLNEIFASAMLL